MLKLPSMILRSNDEQELRSSLPALESDLSTADSTSYGEC